MAASIAGAVARIKRDPMGTLGRDAVEAACRELGHVWRDRTLDPATTIALFVRFADAYRWLRHARPGDTMPGLIVNPHRPGRAEPRVVKRRAKPHDLMNKPRDELRKRLKNQPKTA